MRVTKFPQSNFLIERNTRKILIDPGKFTFSKFKARIFGKVDAILVTHQHFDHLDQKMVAGLGKVGVKVYGNYDIVSIFESQKLKILLVENGKKFSAGGFKITPIDLPHFALLFCPRCGKTLGANITFDKKCQFHPQDTPELVSGPPNTGFLINETFFHPGDGLVISELEVNNAAIPIAGPTVDFKKAWDLAITLSAKRIIPMHYSNPVYKTNPKEFSKENKFGIEVKILADGESLEI